MGECNFAQCALAGHPPELFHGNLEVCDPAWAQLIRQCDREVSGPFSKSLCVQGIWIWNLGVP